MQFIIKHNELVNALQVQLKSQGINLPIKSMHFTKGRKNNTEVSCTVDLGTVDEVEEENTDATPVAKVSRKAAKNTAETTRASTRKKKPDPVKEPEKETTPETGEDEQSVAPETTGTTESSQESPASEPASDSDGKSEKQSGSSTGVMAGVDNDPAPTKPKQLFGRRKAV